MAKLLVSVRSCDEAVTAWSAGADIIDVKEPKNGALGRAEGSVWRDIRQTLPASVVLSAALGELNDPTKGDDNLREETLSLSFVKLGLAGAPSPTWRDDWRRLRDRLSPQLRWIAVIYRDWESAAAPNPAEILAESAADPRIVGALFDTSSKETRSETWQTNAWQACLEQARGSGLLIALAGGLRSHDINTYQGVEPDIFAVRSGACLNHQRGGPIDRRLVEELSAACRGRLAEAPP